MNTNFTQNQNARAIKTMWLKLRPEPANGGSLHVSAVHGHDRSVRRAGRSLTPIEIERLIPTSTQRGGGRDGAVQPGFLGNSYGI